MWKRKLIILLPLLSIWCPLLYALDGFSFLDKWLSDISSKEIVSKKEFSFSRHQSQSCSVRNLMGPIKNQGSRGNCSVFATLSLIERYTGSVLSEECAIRFYRSKFSSRVRRFLPTYEIKFYQKYGVVSEKVCPYKYHLESGEKPSLAKKEYKKLVKASSVELSWMRPEFFRSENSEEMMNYIRLRLEEGNPIVVGLIAPDFWSGFVMGMQGVIDIPKGAFLCHGKNVSSLKNCNMSHAIIITGFDDKRQLLEFKNSWSSDWNDKGYGYMTYRYFQKAVIGLVFTLQGYKAKSRGQAACYT